jgi:hypothetical protein
MVGLGPELALGVGPNLITQGRIFLQLQHSALSVELGAEASLPTTMRQTDGVGFRENLLLGTVAACGHSGFAAACALAKLGQIRAAGLGVDVPYSPTGFIAQAGPRLALSFGLGQQLQVLAHADALFVVTPWTINLNHTAIWAMPWFGAALGIDLAARFR